MTEDDPSQQNRFNLVSKSTTTGPIIQTKAEHVNKRVPPASLQAPVTFCNFREQVNSQNGSEVIFQKF